MLTNKIRPQKKTKKDIKYSKNSDKENVIESEKRSKTATGMTLIKEVFHKVMNSFKARTSSGECCKTITRKSWLSV